MWHISKMVFKYYLGDRKQNISIDEEELDTKTIQYGVSHASVLGPSSLQYICYLLEK